MKKILRLLLFTVTLFAALSAVSQPDGTEIPPMCLPCSSGN